jgi:hypothetical protein
MNRRVQSVIKEGNKQTLTLDVCGHKVIHYGAAKWHQGDIHHCTDCLKGEPVTQEVVTSVLNTVLGKGNAVTYRIRATEILPFHQVGKREPLVRYYLDGIIKGGMLFADKSDANAIIDALDHEQLTAITFLIKFHHEVVEVSNEQN